MFHSKVSKRGSALVAAILFAGTLFLSARAVVASEKTFTPGQVWLDTTGVAITQSFVVTESGYDPLTSTPRKLFVK